MHMMIDFVKFFIIIIIAFALDWLLNPLNQFRILASSMEIIYYQSRIKPLYIYYKYNYYINKTTIIFSS